MILTVSRSRHPTSPTRGYAVQLAVPPGVDYDIRIYDQSNNWVAEGIGSGDEYVSPPSPTGTITSPCPRSGDITRAIPYKLCVSETDPLLRHGLVVYVHEREPV